MRKLKNIAVALGVLSLLLVPVQSAAEPIVVTEGDLHFDTGGPPVFFLSVPAGGFFGSPTQTSLPMLETCFVARGCPGGTSIPFSSTWGDPKQSSIFAWGASANDDDDNRYLFAGHLSFIAPDVTLSPATELKDPERVDPFFRAPFILQGRLAVYLSDERLSDTIGPPLFDSPIIGRGVAELGTERRPGRYTFSSMTYQLTASEPIPEPATLLLVATGGMGVVLRRRCAKS